MIKACKDLFLGMEGQGFKPLVDPWQIFLVECIE